MSGWMIWKSPVFLFSWLNECHNGAISLTKFTIYSTNQLWNNSAWLLIADLNGIYYFQLFKYSNIELAFHITWQFSWHVSNWNKMELHYGFMELQFYFVPSSVYSGLFWGIILASPLGRQALCGAHWLQVFRKGVMGSVVGAVLGMGPCSSSTPGLHPLDANGLPFPVMVTKNVSRPRPMYLGQVGTSEQSLWDSCWDWTL